MEVFPRLHSDHNPLHIRCGGLLFCQGNRPFRFEAAWITHPDYHQVVQSAWSSALSNHVVGLKRVEEDSIIFNKEIFGSIKKRKYCIERRLKGIQKALENIDYASLVYLEHQLEKDYNTILFQEELLWYQKSRDNWIKLGDHNTCFSHSQTVVQRNRNKIHGLNLPDGFWCTDDDILKVEAINYFKHLFCSSSTHVLPQAESRSRFYPQLDTLAKEALCEIVTYEEIIVALNQMHPYKASRPNGFQGILFKQYWHLIGKYVCDLIALAFITGKFDDSIAHTLIVLIPKVEQPSNFKEFRPIILCNTIYKFITKVLVNRLRPMLDQVKLVSLPK